MNFAFIDCTKSDGSTKRLARSHAMKGKNVGKTHPHRSRLGMRGPHTWEQAALTEVRSQGGNSSTAPVQGTINLYHTAWGGDALLSASFPIDVTPQNHELISQFFTIVLESLYPPLLCRPLDQLKSQWLPVLFADRTTYHCSLSLMATMNEFFYGREVPSPKAISHLSQAIRLVNQSLQTPEALSNSNIAVVNFLIVHALVREERSKAEVHLKGLQKIIELRGGLSQLVEDPLLARKICKTDLDFSLHYGTSTCFYRDRMPEVAVALASEGFFMNSNSSDSESRFCRVHPSLRQILLDVNSISSLFNSDNNVFRIDPNMLQEVIVSVGCRLIRFHRLSGAPLEMRCESAYHIGLAAFLATMFLQFGRRRFLKYKLVAKCIKDVIWRGLEEEDTDLMLWLLFIGGVSVLPESDRAWLVLRIYKTVRSLDITSWAELQQCLVQFPWIKSLHNEAARELWDLAMVQAPHLR